MEEIARGRSRSWVWQQLIGFYGVGLVAHARQHARVTPLLVALVIGAVLLGGVSIGSFGRVLETWVSVYYLAGTVSLFAHVISRTPASRTLLLTEEADHVRFPSLETSRW